MNTNLLPEFLRNEAIFFLILAVGGALLFTVGLWLMREIRGTPKRAPGPGPQSRASDSIFIAGTRISDSGVLAAGAASAGVTRTMDSSPSGILGSIARAGGTRPPTHSTSLIVGSSIQPTYGEDRDREQIEPELRQAGYYRPSALAEYKSVRALLVLLPLCIAAAISLLVEPHEMPVVGIGGVVCAALGYSIPRVFIALQARRRRREIERGLPVALDMIVLGLVAGQNVMNSFSRTSHEIRRAFPVLSEEMQLAYRQAELNTLGHALRVWADRCGVQEVYNLSVVLTQAERQGADVSSSLLEFSSSFRTTLRQRADAQANKASFYMLFPTVLCMWIPAAVVLAAPVYVEFADKRTKAREAMLPPNSNKSDPLDKTFLPYLKANNQQEQQ